MLTFYPRNDPEQELRLKRLTMAAASYALWYALALACYVVGLLGVSADTLAATAGGVLLTNALFYAAIRSGFNKRFRDPALTQPQIVAAMCWTLVLMFTAQQYRGLTLAVFIVTMLFGVFQLDRRGFVTLSIFAFIGYLGIVAVEYVFYPERVNPSMEALRVMVLAGSLVWVSFFGAYVSELKRKLHERNAALHEAVEEIGKVARRDDLTQAYNRRYIMEALAREKARADRSRTPFCVVIVDLDHFKTINDRYGHLSGDRVLMAFAGRTLGTLRGMDVTDLEDRVRTFGRYGGEEFIVVLPATRSADAQRCADRIRTVTAEQPFDNVFHVTLSAGVAEYQAGESVEDTLRRADAALYAAKATGRNRVVVDSTTGPDGESSNVVFGAFTARGSRAD
ncbi:MAG: GGDEF domain-containing protein [Pseudomonadota bacterium]